MANVHQLLSTCIHGGHRTRINQTSTVCSKMSQKMYVQNLAVSLP